MSCLPQSTGILVNFRGPAKGFDRGIYEENRWQFRRWAWLGVG